MKNLLILLTLSFALTLSACANTDDVVANSYKSLQTSATTARTLLEVASDLHDSGTLTDEQYAQIADAGRVFYDSYMKAVDALLIYAENKNAEGKEKLLSYIDLLKANVDLLLTIASGLGVTTSVEEAA